MNVSIKNLDTEEQKQWDSFVGKNPHGTPYHLWRYGEAFSTTYNYQRYYLACRMNGDIVGVFPLILIRSSLFGDKLISLPFCEYGGPLVETSYKKDVSPNSVVKALLDNALSIASNLGVDHLEVRNPSVGDVFVTNKFCQQVSKYVTFKLSLLSGEDHIWRSLDKKQRNIIRKSERENITVREVSGNDFLKQYFSLYLLTEKKHGSPPHSFNLFRHLPEFGKSIKIVLASHGKIPVAGAIFLCSKNELYWWNGVSDPKFKRTNANSLLLWETIKSGCKEGYSSLTFGRTRRETGVYHFKAGWGGEEINYIDYVYSTTGKNITTPDPTEGTYPLLSSLWARLPDFISTAIGPRIIKQIGL